TAQLWGEHALPLGLRLADIGVGDLVPLHLDQLQAVYRRRVFRQRTPEVRASGDQRLALRQDGLAFLRQGEIQPELGRVRVRRLVQDEAALAEQHDALGRQQVFQ